MIKKYFLFIVIIILPISFAQQRKMELEGTNKNDIDFVRYKKTIDSFKKNKCIL